MIARQDQVHDLAEVVRDCVVVAVDGSEANTAAIRWASDEALLTRSRVHLVHVIEDELDRSPYFGAGEIHQASRRTLIDAADEVHRLAPELIELSHTVVGSPGHTLAAVAEGAASLVLGRRGHGSFARLLLGSVSTRAASQARVPTVVVPRDWDQSVHRGEPVVVGIDDTDTSDPALRYAVEMAQLRGAPLQVVHAWGIDPVFAVDTALTVSRASTWRRNAEKVLETAVDPWRRKFPEMDITSATHHGHVVGGLVGAAEGAQVLVVGGHRIGRLRAALVGSTAHGVLHHASCPVIVVHERD